MASTPRWLPVGESWRRPSSARRTSAERIRELFGEREQCYEEFFDIIVEQCDVLRELYKPLQAQLGTAATAANKLSLSVVRDVDVDDWARQGRCCWIFESQASLRVGVPWLTLQGNYCCQRGGPDRRVKSARQCNS